MTIRNRRLFIRMMRTRSQSLTFRMQMQTKHNNMYARSRTKQTFQSIQFCDDNPLDFVESIQGHKHGKLTCTCHVQKKTLRDNDFC